MRHVRGQQGFALLLTLVLLMIAAVALARVAHQSASEALAVRDQTEALQRRWAVTSCRATLLPRVGGLLSDHEQGGSERSRLAPRASDRSAATFGAQRRVTCELAGQVYDLVLTDEQAKYNVNAMSTLKIGEDALVSDLKLRSALRELAGLNGQRTDGEDVLVRLQPMIGLDANGRQDKRSQQSQDEIKLYFSYGQLFEGAGPAELAGTDLQQGLSAQITCWGDGRLNLQHASPAVIAHVLGPVLGSEGVRQVLIERLKSPGLDPASWLKAASASTPDQRALGLALLTDHSNATGLWIIGHGRTRSWYTFAVRVYTPLKVLEEQRDAQLTPEDLAQGTPPPLPDPVQRYDYAW